MPDIPREQIEKLVEEYRKLIAANDILIAEPNMGIGRIGLRNENDYYENFIDKLRALLEPQDGN